MANSVKYKDLTMMVGNTINLTYKFVEGNKERKQAFKGILIKIKGDSPQTKSITVRKVSKSGIGIERIIPLMSPFLEKIALVKKSPIKKAKLYYLRGLSEHKVRAKLK